MRDEKAGCHNPSRGSVEPAQQGRASVCARPTLDALVDAACAELRSRARRGRPLPIRGAR